VGKGKETDKPVEFIDLHMDRRDAPPTDEGWYALHDFRTIDWDEWTAAPAKDQSVSIEEGQDYLQDAIDVVDAEEGASVLYAVVGHKADILILHLRPSLAAVEQLERAFEQTALSRYTRQVDSFVSVTEVSGYTSQEYV
jgi:chlorite dismutase